MSSSSYPAAAAAAASTMMMLMLLSSSLALITLLQDTTTIVIMSEAAAASPPPPLPPPSCSPSSHSSPSNLSPPLACVVTTAAASADVEIHYGISHTALSIAMLLPSKAANAWYALGFPAHADACGNSRCGMAPASAVIGSNNVVEPALLTAYANPERTNAWLPTTSGTETSLEDTTVVMWATVDIASIPELAAVPSNATEVSLLWAFGVGNAFDDGFASYHVQNRGVVTIPWAPTFVDPAPAPAPAPEVQSEEEPTPEESAEITFLGSIKQGQSPNSISTESSSTLACTKSSPASILPESLVSSFDPPLECVVESGDIQIHYGISETLLTVAMILPSSAASGWYALGFPANANTCAPNCPMAPADAMVADSATGVVAPARLVGYSNPIKAQDWSPTTSGTSSLDGGQHVMWATVEIASVPELASTMAESASSSMGVLWAYGPGDAFDAGFGAYHNRNKGVISLPLGGSDGGGGGTAPAPSPAPVPAPSPSPSPPSPPPPPPPPPPPQTTTNSVATESSSTLACTKSSPASILPESLVSSFDPPLECVVESGDIQIHYGISETLLTVAMILPSSAASGWYALGFPANANTCAPNCPMAPADAMVADSATGVVAPARLVGYSNPIKAQDWSPTTSGTSSLDGGQHVMWATVEIASVPELASTMAESASSSMGVLWAYGPGDAFDAGFGAYHNRNKGVISLPLGGGGGGGGGGTAPAPSSSRRPPSFFWQVHGAMMVSAWAGLLPAGVALAGALRRAGDGATKAGLFWSHVAAQITGVTLGTAALVVVGVGGSRGWDPGSTPLHHGSVGVAVMVVAWVQVMGGVARPHAGGGRLRLAWEWAHLIMGVGCVVAALWCIVTGSSLLALYVPGVRAEVWWGVAAGVVGGVVLAGGVVKRTVVA
ncbi:hypothetical protein PPROV_000667300 [Pycnococcus provasolii]|uniref:Cytochrome b561 domain-containing protein n=1 Tax=Pycnococcus provasolii TaxID=41880 RepID=A0A830HR57_9CHLO|nr:hypothetical protein PPROV_000667300 [Pycnococcus provasolii]